jgi:5'/3'-nucleotidase SurE
VRILISNDDGFDAQGIKTLVQTLSQEHEIVVVAPNENKSASSSALSKVKALLEADLFSFGATTTISCSCDKVCTKVLMPCASKPSSLLIRILTLRPLYKYSAI